MSSCNVHNELVNKTLQRYGVKLGEDPTKPSSYTIYTNACEELKIKPNSAFLDELPRAPGVYTMLELNCANNYIGDVGLVALLPVVVLNVGIQRIRLSNNGLKNDSVMRLIRTIEALPRVLSLDLSGNKHVSLDVGTRLLRWARNVNHVQRIQLQGTSISAALQKEIDTQCKQNRKQAANNNVQAVAARQRLTRHQFTQAKRLFDGLDVDKTGTLSLEELRRAAHREIQMCSESADGGVDLVEEGLLLHCILDNIDADSDGRISFVEFLQKVFPSMTEDSLTFAMQCYSEYEYVEIKVPQALSDEQLAEVTRIFLRYDKNKDGFVSLNEMQEAMKHSVLGGAPAVKDMFKSVVADENGKMNLNQMIEIMKDFYYT